jgi:hypothetical protein
LLLSTGFGRPVGLTVLCVDCVTQGSLRLAGGGGPTLRPTFSRSVRPGVEPHLGLMTVPESPYMPSAQTA